MHEPSASECKAEAKPKPVLIIVMGVAGTGKTTLALALSNKLHLSYVEGDSLHPPANIEKMSTGRPLNDADREPWLDLLRTTAEHLVAQQQAGVPPVVPTSYSAAVSPPPAADSATSDPALATAHSPHPPPAQPGVLVTCSALKAYYRSILRGTTRPQHGAPLDPLGPPAAADALPTYFVYIHGARDMLLQRVAARQGHYMKANMVDSQLTTLESPEGEEGIVVVDMMDTTEVQVAKVLEALKGAVTPAQPS